MWEHSHNRSSCDAISENRAWSMSSSQLNLPRHWSVLDFPWLLPCIGSTCLCVAQLSHHAWWVCQSKPCPLPPIVPPIVASPLILPLQLLALLATVHMRLKCGAVMKVQQPDRSCDLASAAIAGIFKIAMMDSSAVNSQTPGFLCHGIAANFG